MDIVGRHIRDSDVTWLLGQIIGSFHSGKHGKGLPLGNLTSQLLVNIYLNELDQFVKHALKAKYYVRYADDFVILSHDRALLTALVSHVAVFLKSHLALSLHPHKVSITTLASGVDFLGWVHFPNHRVLRTVTKRRLLRGVASLDASPETVQAYLGLLRHGNAEKVRREVQLLVEKKDVTPTSER